MIVSSENVERVCRLLADDPRLTIRKLALELGVTPYAVHTIIHRDLGLAKKSESWVHVPRPGKRK